ncbi:MAG TPA: GGDEF domain-containing protein [Gammaproteobacteria bacterium]|nr:GGDEF domain-containing protein [Gammaproteobacteria bacterium]
MKSTIFLYDVSTELRDSFDKAGINNSPATLVQVFTTSAKRPFIEGVLSEIGTLLPDATITGATTTAVLFEGKIHEDATIISVIRFESTEIKLSLATDVSPEMDYLTLGQKLTDDCTQPETRLLLCYAAGSGINAENLARGITDNLQDTVLAGCLGTSPRADAEALVFANQEIHDNAVILISLSGEDLQANIHFSTDWMMLGTDMEVSEAKDNIVSLINETPVRDIYTRYLGDEAAAEFPSTCIRFPLLVEREGVVIARLGKALRNDGSIELWGNLYPGEKVRFGIPSPVVAMEDFRFLIESLQEQPCDALFVYPSQVRMHLLRSLTEDEVSQFQEAAPTTGMHTTGQFYYSPGQFSYLHYSQTTLLITEGVNRERETSSASITNPFSQDTLEMRAVSRLVNTTARELEEANQSLEKLANTDSLTSIYNRHKGQILLDQEFLRARRYSRPLSLIMIDIDDFKRINDNYGHQAGDDALIHVARTITPLIRQTDFFIRWGGEEFLIICPETTVEGTAELADRLREAVAAKPAPGSSKITLSVGVTTYHPEDTLEKMIGRADKALYISKNQGKNQVTTWN